MPISKTIKDKDYLANFSCLDEKNLNEDYSNFSKDDNKFPEVCSFLSISIIKKAKLILEICLIEEISFLDY